MNECANSTVGTAENICQENANCVNLPGTFTCVCSKGFVPDKKNSSLCVGKLVHIRYEYNLLNLLYNGPHATVSRWRTLKEAPLRPFKPSSQNISYITSLFGDIWPPLEPLSPLKKEVIVNDFLKFLLPFTVCFTTFIGQIRCLFVLYL